MSTSIPASDDLFAEAKAAFDAGRYEHARDVYTNVLTKRPRDPVAYLNLAQSYKRLGDWAPAGQHFRKGFDLRRRFARPHPTPPLSAFQVEHLAEQLTWLRSIGQVRWYDDAMAAELSRMAKLLRDCYGPYRAGRLPIPFGDPIMGIVDGCANLPVPAVPAVTFSPSSNVTSIPLGHADDMIHIIDDVFGVDALATLRTFLAEATIWYDARPERRYLGAHLHDGLANDFVLRLIGEAERCFSRFVGRVRVSQVWAFKYAPTAAGIDLHADQATWNLNIWPTPTHANLDPASGGMTIAKFRAPPDWPFHMYNASPDKHRAMIADHQIEQVTIPYSGNRAVLFPSKYLHRTNDVRFATSYDLRRINMTFMADPA